MTEQPFDPRRHLPPAIAQRVALHLTADDLKGPDDPYHYGESPDDVQKRRDAAAASKSRLWLARVPSRFASASLSELNAAQDEGGKVSGWWERGGANLVLRSIEPGVGKTHAAYAIGNHAVSTGAWAQAWTMSDFNEAIRPGRDDTAFTVAQECDLLVLDDLGREQRSEWTLERLQGVLDARWSNEKRTVFTTNLPGDQFQKHYGEPIVDRITDGVTMVTVAGTSRRKPAPW